MYGTVEPVAGPPTRVPRRAVLGALARGAWGLGAAGLLAARTLPLEHAVAGRARAARPPRPIVAMRAEPVGSVTGAGSVHRTAEAAGVHATDLGIMGKDGAGGVLVAYGDRFGRGWSGFGGEVRPGCPPDEADWRSNVLPRSTATDLSAGLSIDSWVSDVPGHACQVIPRDRRPGVVEYTRRPRRHPAQARVGALGQHPARRAGLADVRVRPGTRVALRRRAGGGARSGSPGSGRTTYWTPPRTSSGPGRAGRATSRKRSR